MRFLILCALLIVGASISAQTTNADNVRIRKELTLRSITLDSFLRTISSSATHRQGLTAKALYDYIPLTSTAPTTGKVLKWNGTAWTPANDSSGGYYQTVQSNGTPVTQRTILNVANTDEITLTALDNTTKTDISAAINPASIVGSKIASSTITTSHIQNGTILFADWAQNSATTTNNIPKWNGSAWAAAPDVGATVSNGIINDAGTLKIGGSFPSNRILSGNGKLIVSPLTGTQRLEIDKYGLFLFDSTGYISRIIGEYHAHQMKNYWSGSGSASGITGMETTEDDGSYFSTDLTTGQKRFRTSFSLINTTPTATSKWEFLSEDTLTASALDQGNFWIKRFSRNTSAAPRLNFVKRKQSGAIGTNTFLSSGENMGQITFSGDETSTKMSARINAYATQAHTTSAQGGKVVVATTPNGSTTSTDRATIDQNGDVILHSYTSARLDTNTIYGAAAFDPNGKLIRVASGGGGGGSGSVTSVGLSLPSQFTVSGSPVTSSGTLAATWANQSANTIFAAPDGSSGTPTFRSLTATDIPSLTSGKISDFTEAAQDAAGALVVAGTGISATYNDAGNALTIANTGIVGSGTANYVPKFSNSTTLANSVMQEAFGGIGIGASPASGTNLLVYGGAESHIRVETANNNGFPAIDWSAKTSAGVSVTRSMWFRPNGNNSTGMWVFGTTGAGGGLNKMLAIAGGVSIGSNYVSTDISNANSLIVEGNTGFGTTSPARALHVAGTSPLRVDVANYAFDNIIFQSTSAAQRGFGVQFTDWAGASPVSRSLFYQWGTFIFGGTGGGGASGKFLHSNGPVVIGSGGTYQATAGATNGLLVEGNVGIGTIAPAAKLDVNGDIAVLTRSGTATSLAGWDINNKAANVAIGSGLALSSGTLSATDASATNEIQSYAHSGTTSYTNTLSGSGGAFTIQAGSGASISHSAGTVTISATGTSYTAGSGLTLSGGAFSAGGTLSANASFTSDATGRSVLWDFSPTTNTSAGFTVKAPNYSGAPALSLQYAGTGSYVNIIPHSGYSEIITGGSLNFTNANNFGFAGGALSSNYFSIGVGSNTSVFYGNGELRFGNQSSDPGSSNGEGSMWYNSTDNVFRGNWGGTTRAFANAEYDVYGTAGSSSAANYTMGAQQYTTTLDATSNNINCTLGGGLLLNKDYLVDCVGNGSNTITLLAASGYTFRISGDSTPTETSYTTSSYQLVRVRRTSGTTIYIF